MEARGTIFITYTQAIGLREAVRPLSMPPGAPFDPLSQVHLHEKILLLLVAFDTSSEPDVRPLVLTREDVLFINQFLSIQDGDWAKSVLMQTRRALYELRTGVLPGWQANSEKVWRGATMEQPPDDARSTDAGEFNAPP